MSRLRSPRKCLSGCRKICPSPVRTGQTSKKPPFLSSQEIETRKRKERRTLVRETGVEPARPFGHKILSLARLPVPPLPQWWLYSTSLGSAAPLGIWVALRMKCGPEEIGKNRTAAGGGQTSSAHPTPYSITTFNTHLTLIRIPGATHSTSSTNPPGAQT